MNRSHWWIVGLKAYPIRVLFKKLFSMQLNLSIFPFFSLIQFEVSNLILRSCIHFQLKFVQGERCGSSFIFLRAAIYLTSISCCRCYLFSIVYCWPFYQKSTTSVDLHIVLNSNAMINVPVFFLNSSTMLFLLLYLWGIT